MICRETNQQGSYAKKGMGTQGIEGVNGGEGCSFHWRGVWEETAPPQIMLEFPVSKRCVLLHSGVML